MLAPPPPAPSMGLHSGRDGVRGRGVAGRGQRAGRAAAAHDPHRAPRLPPLPARRRRQAPARRLGR